MTADNIIRNIEDLGRLYGAPVEAATAKEVDHITPAYRKMINASPFVSLATSGPDGLDCSPRGDKPGFVRVADPKTLLMPDRRGNNRVDSLRNIVCDPRVGLLFLIPGVGLTLRVNGSAQLSTEPDLLDSLAEDGKPPRSVVVITVETVFFQCARAIIRSNLWDLSAQVDPGDLPTPGKILESLSDNRINGEAYDQAWPKRAKETLW